MRFDPPVLGDIPALRALWKVAFGDDDAFLDSFFSTAFHPDRCLCAWEGATPAAMIFWFRVSCHSQPMAYLYAVATAPSFRGQGVCHNLMECAHTRLQAAGYAGTLLVPGSRSLFSLYHSMGYETCTTVSEFSATAGFSPVPLRPLSVPEYARLRRRFLPEGGVIQEGENLDFLNTQAALYQSPGAILAVRPDGEHLTGVEYLGDPTDAPGVIAALGASDGHFRTLGTAHPFAIFRPLRNDAIPPDYFGLAFD